MSSQGPDMPTAASANSAAGMATSGDVAAPLRVVSSTTTGNPAIAAQVGSRAAQVARIGLGAIDIFTVDVRTDSGAIVVEGHDGSELTIDAIDHDASSSQIDVRIRGDVLQLASKSMLNTRKPWRAIMPPPTGLHLRVPRGVCVRALTRTGNIEVRGMTGDVILETEKGRVEVDSPCQSVTMVTERGQTVMSGLIGTLTFKSASGPLKAEWAALPASGSIDVKTAKGTIDIALPGDARFAARFITGPIPIMNEFENDPTAPVSMSITQKSGGLKVRKTH